MEELQEAGLTERESKVYIALLELGSTTTGPLIKKSEVPNSKIYEVLESLNKKGLSSHIIKGKTKYFQATDPKNILTLIKEKERKLESIIPKLKAKQELAIEKQSTELFIGLKSIRNISLSLIEELKKDENLYGFSTGDYNAHSKINEFYNWYGMKKHYSKIKDHLLISKENKKIFEEAHRDNLNIMKKKKMLRYSSISFPGDTAIYPNKVLIISWDTTPTAILISSKYLAKQYKEFFLKIWNKSN
ncbi:hypothetical protein CL617_05135 [archaeon]|nr:hypothetical protein [archaeon]|tara:strand:+ start:204 stop:941 length:738 start_codon:yes stop_codon:yes gene_type:complete